ncbi:MAG: divalent metal cation transporter [Gemmatimonadetes bacterium]|nr:MAG: divalent metal cation transporter [Gemmatimonadota bacterium]
MRETKEQPGRAGGAGPGWLVAAAFIGPGTVTTATVAGASFGTALLWALLFSVLATMFLQEMSARLGLVTGAGLGEAIRGRFHGLARAAAVFLVVGAIAAGNAAYETGNLLGASLGLQGALGGSARVWAAVVGVAAAGLLWTGSYRVVERAMIVMVGVMSVTFLATALTALPELADLVRGLFVPRVPDGSIMVVVGLIGTTVAPYNLFLHASAVGEKWSGPEALGPARRDLVVSIGVGGLVSMAILVTSAGTIYGTGQAVSSAADMSTQLEPLLGSWARVLFAVGLFAAGMTSAITAPLAAAYATAGALGWPRDLRDARLRAVWIAVLGTGLAFAVTGVRAVPAILFAQAMNGILLPGVAAFLLVAANDRRQMGNYTNGRWTNAIGAVVLVITILLGGRALASVFGLI